MKRRWLWLAGLVCLARGGAVEPAATLRPGGESLTAAALAPDGTVAVASGQTADGAEALLVWSLPGGSLLKTVPQPRVRCLRYSPDGRWLLALPPDSRRLTLYDTRSWSALRTYEAPAADFLAACFTTDGAAILATCGDRRLLSLDVATGQIRDLGETAELGVDVAFDPTGEWLAVGGRVLELWSARQFTRRRTLSLPANVSALSLAFTPDGRRLAVGCNDRKVRLWGPADGQALGELEHAGSYGLVFRVRFSPDGRWLLARAAEPFNPNDATSAFLALISGSPVRVWEVATGRVAVDRFDPCLCSFMQGDSADFTSDSRRLMVLEDSRQAALRFWDLNQVLQAPAER